MHVIEASYLEHCFSEHEKELKCLYFKVGCQFFVLNAAYCYFFFNLSKMLDHVNKNVKTYNICTIKPNDTQFLYITKLPFRIETFNHNKVFVHKRYSCKIFIMFFMNKNTVNPKKEK